MRALVTGASGHIGSFVVRRLLEVGADITVLVRPTSDLWRLQDPFLSDVLHEVEVCVVDFSDPGALQDAVAESRPNVVYHLAWGGITAGERSASEQISHNVTNTLSLLEATKRSGCHCFVGVGSQAEYSERGLANVDWSQLMERGDVESYSAYGLAKLCCGLLAQKFCETSGMRGVWLRLLATYGPQDDERHLLPWVINQLLEGRKPALTSGEQRWDYLFVSDAASAIVAAGLTPDACGIFDLGSGRAPKVRELVEQARDIIDPQLPLGLGELPYRSGQIMHLQADLSPLLQHIQWEPRTDLADGLERTIAWHRAQKAVLTS